MNSTFPYTAPIFYSPSYNGLVGIGNDTPYPFVPSTYLSPFSPLSASPVVFNDAPAALGLLGPVGVTVIKEGPTYMKMGPDANDSENTKSTYKNWFRYYVLDESLYNDMSDVLDYFKIVDGKVKFIKNLSEKKEKKMSKNDQDLIVQFIEDHILTRNVVLHMLLSFSKKTDIEFVQLYKNRLFVLEHIHKKLITIIKDTINDINAKN